MQRRHLFSSLVILLFGLVLTGCKHGGGSDTSENVSKTSSSLSGGDVYVVGRIEIVPALKENEQELNTIGSGRLRNRVYAFFSDQFIDLNNLGMGSGKHAELVDIGKHFVIKRKNPGAMYYTGGMVWMRSSASHSGYMNSQTTINTGHLYLNSKAIYRLRPEDKAVYVGTYRYYRDDYNAITKIEYRDEYAQALQEFRKTVADPRIILRKVAPEKSG